MKNFILFGGETWYAKGGIHDKIDIFKDKQSAIDEGIRLLKIDKIDWYHVYDISYDDIIDRSIDQAFNC